MRRIMFVSSGTLKYFHGPDRWLILEVDPEIVRYYRYFIPKSICLNIQKYQPHISVVRKESPIHMEHWGKYEGLDIYFEYSNIIRWGTIYYWLDAYSDRLTEIRLELGLQRTTALSRPPDGRECFHITLGNVKGVRNEK